MEPDLRPLVAVADWSTVEIPKWERLAAVLWPTLVYDALIPIGEPDELNLVQQAVVAMARCGLRDSAAMGERLCLDQTLIELVIGELKDLGLLEEGGLPTELASAEASSPLGPVDIRIVVQDPFTGRLWPVVADRLLTPPIEWREAVRVLRLQRTTQHLSLVEFDERRGLPPAPTAREIVHAHQAAQHLASTGIVGPESDDDGWLESAGSAPDPALARVEVISDRPSLCWMPAVLYLPAAPDDIDGVCGIGVDGSRGRLLVDALEKAAHTDSIADQVRLRLDKAARSEKLGPYRTYIDRVRADAQHEVERIVDTHWAEDQALYNEFIGLKSKLLEAEADPERAGRLMNDALVSAVRLLEGTAEILNRVYPLPSAVSDQLAKNGRLKRKRRPVECPVIVPALSDARQTWGNGAIPDSLPGDSAKVEENRPTGIYWHLSRFVVSAHYDHVHPLRTLISDDPEWLHKLVAVVRLRNSKGGHFGSDAPTFAETSPACETAIALAAGALRLAEPIKGSSDV